MTAQLVPVADDAGPRRRSRFARVTGVEPHPHVQLTRMVADHRRDAPGLVVGEGIHRIEHQRLDAPGAPMTLAVVEQRDQEALGLA